MPIISGYRYTKYVNRQMTVKDINQKLTRTQHLPGEVFEQMPALIKEACNQFRLPREKDVFLSALLGVLSGCTPGIYGRYYTMKLYTHMYFVIVAPAANGKSTALFAKAMGWALHEQRKKRDGNIQYRKWGLYIAANTSAARFLQQLHENGGEAEVFESEIDTLVNSLNQEWGNFTSNLREASQHEVISYSRKGEDINVEIENPKIAMVLTGTPQQFQRLLPSAENGLFSRISFYAYRQELGRISVKPKEVEGGFEEYFKRKGEEVRDMAAFLEAYPAEFKLTDSQWNAFDDFLNDTIGETGTSHGEEAHSPSLRLGISMFRIAMILSAVRKWERRDTSSELYCTNTDFNAAKTLAGVYMKHTLTMLELTPQSRVGEHIKIIDRLLLLLPYKFSRSEAIELGKTLKLSESTTDRALKLFVSEGKLLRPSQGQYSKEIQI